MKLNATYWTCFVCSIFALGGCGAGEAPDGGDGGSDAPAVGEPAVTTCGIERAEVFVPPRVYAEGAPICDIQVSADYLVYAPFDELYWVPIGGGKPQLVPEWEYGYSAGHISGNDVIQVSSKKVLKYPLRGGTIVEESLPDYCMVGPIYSPDGTVFYCNDGASYLDPPTVDFWSYDLGSKQVTKILAANTIGDQSDFVLAGQYLYTSQKGADGEPTMLYKAHVTGGSQAEIPVAGNFTFHMIGNGADGLYLLGAPNAPYEETGDYGGIYRIAYDGGALEQIAEEYPAFATTDIAVRNGKTIVRQARSVYEVTPGQPARLVASSTCAVHAMAATDTHVFLAVGTSTPSAYEILRIPL